MSALKIRTSYSPQKAAVLQRVVNYLWKCEKPVRAADIAKILGLPRSSVDNIIITLTYYENRLYETDDGKYGLNKDLMGRFIDLPLPDRRTTYSTGLRPGTLRAISY
jgi:hypothetical protein